MQNWSKKEKQPTARAIETLYRKLQESRFHFVPEYQSLGYFGVTLGTFSFGFSVRQITKNFDSRIRRN